MRLLSIDTFSFAKDRNGINQDSILPLHKLNNGYIFGIADGVGGYLGGEIASKIAIECLESDFSIYNPERVFHETLSKIKSLPDEYKKSATTLTFGYITNDKLLIGHIGDCRLYIKEGNKLRQKTKDHTTHQRLLDEKLYTKKELKELPGKNVITTAISSQVEMLYNIIVLPIEDLKEADNKITICIMSDGAHSFWEKCPRFSENTMNSTAKFASALQRRIEKEPSDDYSLIIIKFEI